MTFAKRQLKYGNVRCARPLFRQATQVLASEAPPGPAGGLLQLMNELFLPGSFDSRYLRRSAAPPSPTSALAAGSSPAAALSSERTQTRTRAPGRHGTAGSRQRPRLLALSLPASFKSCSKSFLLSFMCAVLLIEELGKCFRGAPRGAGPQDSGRADRTRGQLGFVLPLCLGPRGVKTSAARGPTGESAASTTLPNPPPETGT